MEETIGARSRGGFRPHALDGALLWFHPRTGVNVRWDGPETRGLSRRAPRVVLFGITNRCNLACSFCSRDRGAASDWTVDSAFDMLSGLARRGVLEVAFGGGEPLVFSGLGELAARLAEATPLALHVTTNGALLTPARLRELRPHLGEIRLSVYEDTAWERPLELLAEAGGVFGANVLVTPARLGSLPGLLERLAESGCHDVALLRYVGPGAGEHLAPEEERRLAGIIASSPVRVRLSVCFGDRLHPVPRLFEGSGGDCGAGEDFLTLTSDRAVKACSFQPRGIPVRDAADVIAAYLRERARLRAPAPLPGCERGGADQDLTVFYPVRLLRRGRSHEGRDAPDQVESSGQAPARARRETPGRGETAGPNRAVVEHPPPWGEATGEARSGALPDGIRVWRGFSGNNSGDCVLVGRFEEVDAARRYIDDLVPGWAPGIHLPGEWRALLEGEGIRPEEGERTPDSIAQVGRTVMAYTDMTLEDDFPSLRSLVWKRGGRVVYSGVHEHVTVEIVAGLRFGDVRSLEAADTALAVDDIAVLERRALDLYGTVSIPGAPPPSGPRALGALHARIAQIEALAERHGAVVAAELAPVPELVSWPRLLAARPAPSGRERLWACFRDEASAAAAARGLDDRATCAGRWLVVEAARIRPRVGYFVQRSGGIAEWMGGGRVEMGAVFWRAPRDAPELQVAEVVGGLRPMLQPEDELSASVEWRSPRVKIRTDEPGRVLTALVAFARDRGVETWVHAGLRDRLVAVIQRLGEDLSAARR